MSVQNNRYFNDATMAQAASNLASLFAPPSGADLSGYAAAKATREKAQYLADLIANPNDPTADRRATYLGAYAPTQSWEALRMGDATTRRGQDIGASTELEKQRLVNEGSLQQLYAAPTILDPGQVAITSNQFQQNTGLGPRLEGAPKPLSETEQLAQERADLRASGLLTDQMLVDSIRGEQTPVQIVGPDGKVRVQTPGAAIRRGDEVFVNRGAEAAPKAITFERNGQRVGGFVKDGQFVDATGRPLTEQEAGTAVNIGTPQGSNEQLGVTNSNQTDYNRVMQTVTQSNLLIDDLEKLIRGNAGAAGLPGTLQSVAQNIVQVGKELSAVVGEDPDAIVTPDRLAQLDEMLPGAAGPYNPVFQEIRSGMLQLAYLNAQRDNPRGEVSRFALERQIEALGQGLLGNDQAILASLGMNRRANDRALQGAEALVGRLRPQTNNAPGPAAPPAGQPAPSNRMRFDAEGNPIP
ncbi:MAG: hypothetical protein ACOVN5_07105 [Aquidulcibacter sp.]